MSFLIINELYIYAQSLTCSSLHILSNNPSKKLLSICFKKDDADEEYQFYQNDFDCHPHGHCILLVVISLSQACAGADTHTIYFSIYTSISPYIYQVINKWY